MPDVIYKDGTVDRLEDSQLHHKFSALIVGHHKHTEYVKASVSL